MTDFNFVVKNTLQVNGSFTANSSVVNAAAIQATSVNTASLYISSASVATLITSNAATAYTNATTFASNATNITTGTLPYAQLGPNVVNTSGQFVFASVISHNANLVVNGAVFAVGNATLQTTNSVIQNTSSIVVGNTSQSLTINSSAISGSANNASYLGGIAAASYVNTAGAFVVTGVHTHNANLFVNTATFSVGNATSNAVVNSSAFTTSSNTVTLGSTVYVTATGNVGIGTSTPSSRLTISGVVESTSGGFKFSDGTVQTSRAVTYTYPTSYGALGTYVLASVNPGYGIGTTFNPGSTIPGGNLFGSPGWGASDMTSLGLSGTWMNVGGPLQVTASMHCCGPSPEVGGQGGTAKISGDNLYYQFTLWMRIA